MRLMQKALTFDDVLLVPAFSAILPHQVCLKTRLTRRISLNMPLISAPLDTVTESQLAKEVVKVKRFESGIVRDPITVPPDLKVLDVMALSRKHGISGFPVVEGEQLVGIATNRDLRFETRLNEPVRAIMTPRERLITVPEGA